MWAAEWPAPGVSSGKPRYGYEAQEVPSPHPLKPGERCMEGLGFSLVNQREDTQDQAGIKKKKNPM